MRNREYILMLAVASASSVIASIAMFIINIWCGLICVVLSIALILIFIIYTNARYRKIKELNDYLSMVCAGNYSLNINENTEGELSILKNNLYKVVVMLQSSNEALKNDKLYLADSLADISHQLKTPLTSMMVMTDLIKNEENPQNRGKFVDIIESQLDKMKWLISTLLKLSKLDADTADFNMVSLNIDDIVDSCLNTFELSLELKGITVNRSTNGFEFVGDRNWSIEAIENIIKNCIEHTENGGVIGINASSTNVYNQLVISDNGCGIDNEDLPHIFERFYHGKNSNNDSVGIGLALSKEILSKEKASIEVESENQVGTRFVIKFYKSIV